MDPIDNTNDISNEDEIVSALSSSAPSSSLSNQSSQMRRRPGRPRNRDRSPALRTVDINSQRRRLGITGLNRADAVNSISNASEIVSTLSSSAPFSSMPYETPEPSRRPGRPRNRDASSALNIDGSPTQSQASTSTMRPNVLSNATLQQNIPTTRYMPTYWDCGDAVWVCMHCEAMLWYGERSVKTTMPANPNFSLCCSEGKVLLPFLQAPPHPLGQLLDFRGEERSRIFKENIKFLNAMFAFTSTGGRICTDINDGHGPYTFRLNGHNHHRIGTLLPTHEDGRPRFAQLYVYDTANEIDNRFYALQNCVPTNTNEAVLRNLVSDLLQMLDENNVLVQAFRMARERFNEANLHPVTLRLIGRREARQRQYSLPTSHEVAALLPGDGNPTDSRDILIEERSSRHVRRISELHPSFMALQYPLLFPYGEDGFHVNIPLYNIPPSYTRKYVTLREYYCYRLQVRRREAKTLHKSGRLFQTYIVDAYSAILEHDLDWYRRNQNKIRSELYSGLQDRLIGGDVSCANVGRRVILPPSFTGGPRHMIQQYQDAMAICRWAGTPDLFITMTCNPKWPEIQRHVNQNTPAEEVANRPDITARVFKIKLDELMKDIRKNNHFGRAKAVIYTIEFQKRGLPHCHCLLFLNPEDKISTPEDIDKFISAELPSEMGDPCGFAAVRNHMVHGPCGYLNPSNSCMINGRCSKMYPKHYCADTFIKDDGWPCYRRPNNGRQVSIGNQGIRLDNQFVVPHNLNLLVKYGCHINVEWFNQGQLIKYLFSYLNKGPDRATVVLEGHSERTSFASLLQQDDEIEQYINCRYISASEACWKIFGFEMHYRSIAVDRLPFHEEGGNRVYFYDDDMVETVANRETSAMTKFTEWFTANQLYPEGRTLTYTEFPTRFTWHAQDKAWRPRRSGFSIGRIYYVSPASGEKYYLRMLLNVVRGPLCFKDIRTVDGVEYPTYISACKALNLLGDDTEWVESIRQASQWQMGNQLRELFVSILIFCTVSDYAKLFEDCFPYLNEDVAYNQRRLLGNPDIVFTDAELLNYTLMELEKVLRSNNRSLLDFPHLPHIDHHLCNRSMNRLIAAERVYNVHEERASFNELHNGLNPEQMEVFSSILSSINGNTGGVFFVYGSGGTGKTYLWRTLIAYIRSRGKIVLSVASSGIASLLLPGGRTTHSRFKIPIDVDADSCCSIDVGSELAELINAAELIIWDEAPLQHRYAFEAVDRTFRDVCRGNTVGAENHVFGGKVVVIGGDFRQILPIISNGSRGDIVGAVVNRSSTIWPACNVHCLTTNMRLSAPNLSGVDRVQLQQFSKWILDMGAGRLPAVALTGEDESTWVTIPSDLLIPVSDDPFGSIISNTFPEFQRMFTDIHYLKDRCILCPTNDEVDDINGRILHNIPSEMHDLYSADEISSTSSNLEEMQMMYSCEFLNTLKFSGVPNHVLQLKVGAPIILLRNLNLQRGLCNGTRLVVTQITRRVIEAVIITGTNVGRKAFIGRIDMTPTTTEWPFEFKRRQFPVKVCFAMTINKSQGQTFNNVCVYLSQPVFTHGQLYVAASRVTSRSGLRFYVDNKGKCPNNLTKNVVYKEVFYNLPLVDRDDN